MFDIRQSKAHSVGTITVAIFPNIGFAGQSSVCNSVELGKTVKITVTEADSSNNIYWDWERNDASWLLVR